MLPKDEDKDVVKELETQKLGLVLAIAQLEKSLVVIKEVVEKWEPALTDWRNQATSALKEDLVSLNDISNIKKNIANVKEYLIIQNSKIFSKNNEIATLRVELNRIEKDLTYWAGLISPIGQILELKL